MSIKVFVSYRRSDSRHAAGRLRDHLADAFGAGNVFFDVDSIEFGLDFRTVISETLRTVDAVVVLIGPRFDPSQLAQDGDYVRMELLEAFTQNKLVVPVLVDDAPMPPAETLPAQLQSLPYRNAASLRPDPDFRHDATRLVERLRRIRPPSSTGPPVTPAASHAPPAAPVAPLSHPFSEAHPG